MSVWDFDSALDIHGQLLEPDFLKTDSTLDFNNYEYDWPNYSFNEFDGLFEDMYSPPFGFSNISNDDFPLQPSKKFKCEDLKPIIIPTKNVNTKMSPSAAEKLTLSSQLPSGRKTMLLETQPDIKMNFYDDLGVCGDFYATEVERRSDHNVKEQQRRRAITNLMEKLRLAVPLTKEVEKATRLKILRDSTEFIEFQREEVEKKIQRVRQMAQNVVRKAQTILNNSSPDQSSI